MRYACALFILVVSLSLYSCGEDSPVTPEPDFVSFLTSSAFSNGAEPFVGFKIWDFEADGVVSIMTVDSILANRPLFLSFIGFYELTKSKSKGVKDEYVATCEFMRKSVMYGDSTNIIQYYEKIDVKLRRDGEFLLINGVRFNKYKEL